LKGFGGACVIEIIEDHPGEAYRAVYTVKFERAIYVLHAFQKKSRKGIETPQEDIALIRRRLKVAEQDYEVQRQGKK
jgi:phage-related protein